LAQLAQMIDTERSSTLIEGQIGEVMAQRRR
jgi:hypothetical protein